MKPHKTWRLVRSGSRNIGFSDFVKLVEAFGFEHARTSGSHRIYNHRSLPGMLNLQPAGPQAKPYQVQQFVRLVEKYGLILVDGNDDGDDE